MATNEQVCIIASQCLTQFGTTNIHKILNVPTNASLSCMKGAIEKILQLGQLNGIYTQCQLETVDKFHFLLRSPITLLDYVLLPEVRAEYTANDKLVDSRMKNRRRLSSRILHLTCKLERTRKQLQEAKELIEIKDKLLRLRGLLDRTTIKTGRKQPMGCPSLRPNTPVSPQNELNSTPSVHFVPFNLEGIVNHTPLWNGHEEKKATEVKMETRFASGMHMEDGEAQGDMEVRQILTHSEDLKELFDATNEELGRLAHRLTILSENNREVISKLKETENNLVHVQEKIDFIECQVKIHEKLDQVLNTSLRCKEEENRKLCLLNGLLKDRLMAANRQDMGTERIQYDDSSLMCQSFMLIILIILAMVPLVWTPQF